MDIFKLANEFAKNMSENDKNSLENMDMEKMISHVTQNVFKMVGNDGGNLDMGDMLSSLMGNLTKENKVEIANENDTDDDEPIIPKTRDICFDLNVDLEDFYTGKKKKLNVKRKRIIEVDGKQTVTEEKKKLIIPIERGMKDEQQIRFEGEADQIPGYKPGDIIITLIENEHPFFQRDNDNLIIVKNINIYEIYDIKFDIKHLDSRVLRILKQPNDSLHLNDSFRKIVGQGMPIYKKQNEYGDLFIRFNLVIPKTIETSNLNLLKTIFGTTDPLQANFEKSYTLENVSETDLEDLESTYTESETETETETETSESEESESETSVSSSSDSSVEVRRRRR
jgi:DnaJ-class molecular chaperone